MIVIKIVVADRVAAVGPGVVAVQVEAAGREVAAEIVLKVP
jgi:hypothetical protein